MERTENIFEPPKEKSDHFKKSLAFLSDKKNFLISNFGKFLASASGKIVVASFLTLAIFVVLLSMTAVTAHTDTEEKSYRQVVFSEVQKKIPSKKIEKLEADYEIGLIKPIKTTIEVDKITPTPTPIFDPNTDDVWIKLAHCESKQNWSIDTGNGYYGGLQFNLSAWASVGGSGKPSDASKDEQIMRGKMLQQRRGWGPWGDCSKKLGLN